MENFKYLSRLFFDRKVLFGKEFYALCCSITMAKHSAMELFGVMSPEYRKVEAELDLARRYLDDAEAILEATFNRISKKFKEEE
jgi:hypothetical protein